MIDRGLGLRGEFRLRGKDVSRIEGFSDAAFAFAITLLVVSLEVPATFDDLLNVMRGVPAFAVCFATLVWLWSAHYKFFRRFGLQDPLTVVLNSALLFVVMLYVYPLKFVFTIFMGMISGIQPNGTGQIAQHQVGDLFVVYGVGFMAVFALLAAMNHNAWRMRDDLELDATERLVTRGEITRCWALCGVGVLSIVVALLLPGGAAGLAGIIYAFIGVVEFVLGVRMAKAKTALATVTLPS